MRTRLFRIGANAAAANRRRACSTAVASAVSPYSAICGMKRRMRSVASWRSGPRCAPATLSVSRSAIHGARSTPIAAAATSASIDTVTTALVASSSSSWRWRTNCGTRVAVSTPPTRSS